MKNTSSEPLRARIAPICRLWLKAPLVAGMFALGLLAVAATMPALRALLGRRSEGINAAIVRHWNRTVCGILNLRLHVAGETDPRARFVVANHVSWLDIIALGSLWPCVFVAKAEVARWPVLGPLARGIGTLFVRRGDLGQTAATAEQMLWRLRRGERVVLFPEGTTTAGDRVLRFHGKLFQPAELAGAEVQAIALRYRGEAAAAVPFVGEDAFLPHLLTVLKLPRIDLELTYCPSLPGKLGRGALAAATRRGISEALGLRPAAPGDPLRTLGQGQP
jgi:1-acyl-sn-glycerol-3-phosphate acyltransferase